MMSLPLINNNVRNYNSLSSDYQCDLDSCFKVNFDVSRETHDHDTVPVKSDAIDSDTDRAYTCVPRRRSNSYPPVSSPIRLHTWSDAAVYELTIEDQWRHTPNRSSANTCNSDIESNCSDQNGSTFVDENESWVQKMFSCRWKLAYLCFLARSIQGATRQSFGVAILGIAADYSAPRLQNYSNNSGTAIHKAPASLWSSELEGMALAAFNSGSAISPFLIGYINLRVRGRLLMTVCLVIGGLFSVLLPALASLSPALIIVSRALSGASMTGMDTLIQALWAKWAPRKEKASLTTSSYTGSTVGGLLAYPISSFLISINGDGKGWPFIFYFFGCCCFLLAPTWWICVYDNPGEHPRISKKEVGIISNNINLSMRPSTRKKVKIPWRQILTSAPVWAVFMSYVTNKWAQSFIMPFLPRFFHDKLHQSIGKDSLYGMMPFIGGIIANVVSGRVSDWLVSKGMSVSCTRKMFQAIGCLGCAVWCLLIVILPRMTDLQPTILIILIVSFQNLTYAAFRINILDIAPRFAGLLCGLISSVSSIMALPGPVIGSMLIAWKTQNGWHVVFCLVAAFNVVGGITFIAFSDGTVQDWALRDIDQKDISISADSDQKIEPVNHKEQNSKNTK